MNKVRFRMFYSSGIGRGSGNEDPFIPVSSILTRSVGEWKVENGGVV